MTLKSCIGCGAVCPAAWCDDCRATQPVRVRGKRPARPWRWRRLSERARRLVRACAVCGTETDLTADHLHPVSLGGAMIPGPDGIRILCRAHNSAAMGEQRAAHRDDDDPGASGVDLGEARTRRGVGLSITHPPGEAP